MANNGNLLTGNEASYRLVIIRTKDSIISGSQGDGIDGQSRQVR